MKKRKLYIVLIVDLLKKMSLDDLRKVYSRLSRRF